MTKIKKYETLIAYKPKSFTQTNIQREKKDMQNKSQVILQT